VAAIAQYHKELDAFGTENSPAMRRLAGLNAWLSAHAAMRVAAAIQGDVTRDSMTTALQKTTGMDLYGLVTFSPSELAGLQGTFARFPKTDYHTLTFDSPTMKDAGQAPIPDPLQTVRGGGA
jgi:hypothetical protein